MVCVEQVTPFYIQLLLSSKSHATAANVSGMDAVPAIVNAECAHMFDKIDGTIKYEFR